MYTYAVPQMRRADATVSLVRRHRGTLTELNSEVLTALCTALDLIDILTHINYYIYTHKHKTGEINTHINAVAVAVDCFDSRHILQ